MNIAEKRPFRPRPAGNPRRESLKALSVSIFRSLFRHIDVPGAQMPAG
jgi:hypothetical protein